MPTASRIPFAFVLISLLIAAPAGADVPRLLGYQGRLLRADGTAASGTASVAFAVYSVDSGGTPLWSETQTLGLSDGFYVTFLGLVSAPPASMFDGGARWLEVAVGGEILWPRQSIGSVSYALTAQNVAGGTANVSLLKVGGQTVVDADGRLAGAARYTAGAGIGIDANQAVSLQPCAEGQALVRGASSWQCATAGTVTEVGVSGPLAVTNASSTPLLSMPQAGTGSAGYLSSADWSRFNAKLEATTQCGGDLAGNLAAPTVVRLQSRAVASTLPQNGQVLRWNAAGQQWEPSTDFDSGGTVTEVRVTAPLTSYNGSTTPEISIAAASASADGYLSSGDWNRFNAKYDTSTQCTGDLSGTYLAPLVSRLQGVSVATSVPGAAQVLRFDGSAWAPASLQIGDVGGLSSGYLDLSGTQTISGAKNFSSAPSFGTPLAVESGGIGTASAAAHAVFAGPAGAAGAPSFRSLEEGDLPSLDTAKIASGTLGVARGGTGTSAAFSSGSVLFAGTGGIYSQNNSALFWDNTSGFLGIGTSSPGQKLWIEGAGGGSGVRLVLSDTDSGGRQWHFVSGGSAYGAGKLNIRDGIAAQNRLTVDTSGNVGIGTSTPGTRLAVADTDAGTNTVRQVLDLNHFTSGTAADGMGTGIQFAG